MRILGAAAFVPVFLIIICLACGCSRSDGIYFAPPPGYYGLGFINYNVDISAVAEDQKAPDCVYCSTADEYFVVWQDLTNGVDYDIYGAFFDTLRADPLSSDILICTVTGDQLAPRAAYNHAGQEILVVWEDYEAGDSDIYGRLIDAVTGAPIGADFPISSVVGHDEREPRVIYNPDQNNYMVTWDEFFSGDFDVLGLILNANGTASGSTFAITTTAADQQSALAAYDTVNNRYLVVYMDSISPTEADIFGQLVAHDGGLIGPDILINDDTGDQAFPSVAFNPNYARFLVVWEDDYLGDYDITAQEIMGTGTLYDTAFLVTPDYDQQNNAVVTFNYYYGEYLVLWEDTRRGALDIYGQSLNSAADYLGYNTRINDGSITCVSPAVCPRTQNGEFFAVWSAFFSPDFDIIGQLLY